MSRRKCWPWAHAWMFGAWLTTSDGRAPGWECAGCGIVRWRL